MKSLLLAVLITSIAPINAQGIFTDPTPPTPAEQAAVSLTRGMDMELARRKMYRMQNWRLVWENPKATPQAILNALGTDAVKVLTASTVDAGWFTSLATALGVPVSTFIDPKYLTVKAGWDVTPNQDGSVTVTPPVAP